jgi:hypothetical protein
MSHTPLCLQPKKKLFGENVQKLHLLQSAALESGSGFFFSEETDPKSQMICH